MSSAGGPIGAKMFWTDRTSSDVCAPTVPGKAAASSKKARRNRQLFCFSPFELVILASAEKFQSGNQSIKLTAISDSLLSPSLTSLPITHKTGLLRQAVFESITIDFFAPDAFLAECAPGLGSGGSLGAPR
jgi:hypothetical protein